MFAMFRGLFKPNALRRRIMAGFCAAFVLTTIAFSSLFVSAEADHDCCGHDCPVCQEMQAYVANFQLLGSSFGETAGVSAPAVSFRSDTRVVCAHRAPALTLQRLDVRFDE